MDFYLTKHKIIGNQKLEQKNLNEKKSLSKNVFFCPNFFVGSYFFTTTTIMKKKKMVLVLLSAHTEIFSVSLMRDFSLFLRQSGGSSRWRVCYQQGLPCLVWYNTIKFELNGMAPRLFSVQPNLPSQEFFVSKQIVQRIILESIRRTPVFWRLPTGG